MKKILKLGMTGLLLGSLNLVADDNFVTKMVKDKIDKTSKDINKAIEDDRIYELHADIGITSLQRENKSNIYKLNVDPLFEVTAGVMFFPDSLKLDLAYKTSLNGDSSDSGSREQSNSGAKTVMIRATVVENKKYGYLDVAYEDITLNGTLKNTGFNSIYVVDKTQDKYFNNFLLIKELKADELIATEEKTKIFAMNYRLPILPNIGIMAAKGTRNLPVVVNDPLNSRAIAYSEAKGDLIMYGIGYYENFAKAKKNTLIIEQVAYNRGIMKTKMNSLDKVYQLNSTIINNTVNMLAESYTIALGYKFSLYELKMRMDYHVATGKVTNFPEVKETELATNISIGMRF